jgi:hypothetical protein
MTVSTSVWYLSISSAASASSAGLTTLPGKKVSSSIGLRKMKKKLWSKRGLKAQIVMLRRKRRIKKRQKIKTLD